jgi:hypothetical protein
MRWKLTALSDKCRQFVGPQGHCDLVLEEGVETRIGRAVSGRGSYCLPAQWIQISSNHVK